MPAGLGSAARGSCEAGAEDAHHGVIVGAADGLLVLQHRGLGLPEDTAKAATFLLWDAASWITGETLVVDGGITVAGS
jgi:NAD(P)-dependent dehydrogenase (short-subunit alcohol dehydrogenase family)